MQSNQNLKELKLKAEVAELALKDVKEKVFYYFDFDFFLFKKIIYFFKKSMVCY